MEQSAESDTAPQPDGEPEDEEDAASQSAGKEEPVQEQDLQAQVCVCVYNTNYCGESVFLPDTLLALNHWQKLFKQPTSLH